MPNEFKIKNGLLVDQGPTVLSGSLTVTGSTTITGSLSTTLGIVVGSDPGFSVDSTGATTINTSGNALNITSGQGAALIVAGGSNGNNIATFKSDNTDETLAYISTNGSIFTTGSITAIQGITGSLEGTASFAISASFATDNYPLNSNPTGYLTSSFTQVNPATLTSGSWSLVSGSYELNYANTSISTSSFITFVPNNASNLEVTSCKMLPQIDSLSGSCKFYAMFPPQTDIVGQLIIQI